MKTLELFARAARVYHYHHDQGHDHNSRQAVYKQLLSRHHPATVLRHAKQIAGILDRKELQIKYEGRCNYLKPYPKIYHCSAQNQIAHPPHLAAT